MKNSNNIDMDEINNRKRKLVSNKDNIDSQT